MERPEYRSSRRTKEVKVYTVCQESRYLIVRNVPALGCIDELVKLFALYGPIEEYRLLDEEECEEFTDVYWLKFAAISNARFAKRKLDEYQFLGNLLEVTYAPDYESVNDTSDKLEERRRTVMNRINSNRKPEERQQWHGQGPRDPLLGAFDKPSAGRTLRPPRELLPTPVGSRGVFELKPAPVIAHPPQQDDRYKASYEHFEDPSMDATVQAIRHKLDKLAGTKQTRAENTQGAVTAAAGKIESFMPASKKQRQDNRRRI